MEGEVSEALVKEFRYSTDPARITASVRQIDASIDREKYLSMKECVNCSTAFGKHSSKKYYCHFCYVALCSTCSLLNITHPETEKEERACNQCYVMFLKDKVIEISDEFVKVKLRTEIEEKEREIAKRKRIVEEIEAQKKALEVEKLQNEKEIKEIDEKIGREEAKRRENEESNKKMTEFIAEMVKQGKISGEECKQFSTSFVRADTPQRECIKCSVF